MGGKIGLPDFVEICYADAIRIPGGRGMVKIHFRTNARWRTASKLEIRIFMAFFGFGRKISAQ